MDITERMILRLESADAFLRDRVVLTAFSDFKPKSNSSKSMQLNPEFAITEAEKLLKDFTVIFRKGGRYGCEIVLRKKGILLEARFSMGSVLLDVMSTEDDAYDISIALIKRFEPHIFVNQEEDGVWVDFTYMGSHGISTHKQFLKCPVWKDIRDNYPGETHSSVENLIGLPKPWMNGRLIIWHGVPGTGKTFAIRALFQEWKKKFEFIVVNDSEIFAASPGYYYSIASKSRQLPSRFSHRMSFFRDDDDGDDEDDEPGNGKKEARKRRMFIMEDSADLLMQESRISHYDKIGKLLNLTDGLYGQGREDLFLLTFNEELTRIDPAFLRPGRCVAKTEFVRFSPQNGASWLEAHGAPGQPPSKDLTIAELYAKITKGKKESSDNELWPRKIGFQK